MGITCKKLSCIVIDDEPLAREIIRRYIAQISSLQLLGECSNALQALTFIQQYPVDLIFTDIQMPEIMGTELIKTLKNPPKIIFITAHPNYALEGYELGVIDYLLKPVKFDRFLKAVNKLFPVAEVTGIPSEEQPLSKKRQSDQDDYLYFRADRKSIKVMLHSIVFIEGMKNYVKIHTDDGVIITKTSIRAIEAMLPQDLFVRVHRSFIVSKSKIKSFTGEEIKTIKKTIPIGKLFRNTVLKVLS